MACKTTVLTATLLAICATAAGQVSQIKTEGLRQCLQARCRTVDRFGTAVCVERIGNDTYWLTAAHNIAAGRRIAVGHQQWAPARLVAASRAQDLALVVVSGRPITPINLGSDAKPGQYVVHSGYPWGRHRAVAGEAVNANWRSFNSNLSHGDSGGPVTDRNGRLVGLTCNMSSSDHRVGWGPSASQIKAFLDISLAPHRNKPKSPPPVPTPDQPPPRPKPHLGPASDFPEDSGDTTHQPDLERTTPQPSERSGGFGTATLAAAKQAILDGMPGWLVPAAVTGAATGPVGIGIGILALWLRRRLKKRIEGEGLSRSTGEPRLPAPPQSVAPQPPPQQQPSAPREYRYIKTDDGLERMRRAHDLISRNYPPAARWFRQAEQTYSLLESGEPRNAN